MNVLQAVECNNPERLKRACCVKGANLEAVDDYGNTPLLKACYLGHDQLVHVLVQLFNVNLNAINYMGQNALTLAVYSGNETIVRYLLTRRSYRDFTLSSMIPPLCVAILRGHRHLINLFWTMDPRPDQVKTAHGLTAKQMVDICKYRLR